MGARQSSGGTGSAAGNTPRARTYSSASQASSAGVMGSSMGAVGGLQAGVSGTSGMSGGARSRTRSLGSVQNGSGHALSIPSNGNNTAGGLAGLLTGMPASPDSEASTPEEGGFPRHSLNQASSLPVHLLPFHVLLGRASVRRNREDPSLYQGIKCPVCSKFVPPDEIECHLVMCLTKPRISYNEDVLTEDKEECVICLEDLVQGDTIARLPCLCIYHKSCIDSWFKVNRSCPEHPND